MRRIQSVFTTSVIITALLFFGIGWFFAKNTNAVTNNDVTITPPGSVNGDAINPPTLGEVWKKLKKSYYDTGKLNISKLQYGAVKGFVNGIEDPYTVFMTPEEWKDFEDGLEGQLEGIGAELEIREGKLVVVTPLKNSPAEKAGLKTDDVIFKIDGKLAQEMTLFEAIRSIRGKKGTNVTLTLIREKEPKPIDVTITRSEIIIDSVTVEKLEGDLFHISINQFNDHTLSEFGSAIEKILLEKAKGIVLDVRGNGGGYLDTSIDVLSELLEANKVAVVIKKQDGKESEEVKTKGGARISDIPLVVLINKGSASASEIVAGALQDYKRAVLIGEKTFGKGSVQEIDELSDGSRLRLTIAKWFTPLGRTIDQVGIAPDIEIKLTEEDVKAKRDPQLEAAVKYLKK